MKLITKSLIGLFLVTLCIQNAQSQEISKTFTGIKKINLSTAAGSCKVIKGTSNEVQVKVSHTYSSSDYQPIIEQEGTTLVLKEDFENGQSYSGRSSWELIVPENMEIKFSSGSGNMEVSEMNVRITGNTGSGDYNWTNVKGESKINTGSGNITLDNFSGEINVNTGSGDIQIAKAEGDLQLNAGSGNINLSSVKGVFAVNTGSGDVTAKGVVLTGRGSFNTGSGDASVTLAAAPDYNLAVNSGSGNALLNLNGNKLDGTLIMTANKRNGKIVAPFTFDKTEEIDTRGNDIRIQKTALLGKKDIKIKVSTGSGRAEVSK